MSIITRGLAAVCVAGAASTASAAIITFVGPTDENGTGFGNVLNVLSLQNTPEESGAVIRQNGADVLLGDAKNQSQTRTIAEVLAAGAGLEDLGVVFNIAEPGNDNEVTIQAFEVIFYGTDDAELFSATWNGPLTLESIDQGVGGAGYTFDIDLTQSELDLLAANPLARIGITVDDAILDTAGAPENFYLIPSPGAASLLALGGLLAARRRR
jgi:hypothetical protein